MSFISYFFFLAEIIFCLLASKHEWRTFFHGGNPHDYSLPKNKIGEPHFVPALLLFYTLYKQHSQTPTYGPDSQTIHESRGHWNKMN